MIESKSVERANIKNFLNDMIFRLGKYKCKYDIIFITVIKNLNLFDH